MALEWNNRRFSGGALVFDLINTVVYRQKPALRFDRIAECAEATRFAGAATSFRREECQVYPGPRDISAAEHGLLLKLREAAYERFQQVAEGKAASPSSLAQLLRLIAEALERASDMPFVAETAVSALRQTCLNEPSRIKACPGCDWLFLDRSKNASRIWCDMAVCGNRHKARLNYERRSKSVSEAKQ
jgi:predicted RNA-binding Zn ribbon-like protein